MIIFIFIIGLTIGSFLNVCIYRIPNNLSIAYPASHCTSCNHNLSFLDLVPLFSYIFLGGKCRYCKAKFSIRYPLLEFFTGILFVLVYINTSDIYITLKFCILASYLLVVSMIDLDTMEIYDSINIVGAILAVPFLFRGDVIDNFVKYGLGGLLGIGIILLIIVLTKGAMGTGDMIFLGVIGLYVGYPIIIMVFILSTVLASIVSIILIILKIKNKKDYIPFGPFIGAAAFICSLWAEYFFELYIKMLI